MQEKVERDKWKAKIAKQLSDAASHVVVAAEADLFEAQLRLKDAQMIVMMHELEMGLAREEALLELLSVLGSLYFPFESVIG